MQGNKLRKSLKLMLFLIVMGLLVTGCTKEKEKASGDEPVTYNTAILYNEQHSSYDKKAEARRQEILETTDTVKPSTNGITYYVSYKGDDNNDGKTPETAWRSAEKLAETRGTLIEGDVVLFERGGVYRGAFTISSGVSYGAYGEGPKPCIYESMQNYADEALWEAAEEDNVWKINVSGLSDVGNLVFNHGEACAAKKIKFMLNKDFDFFHDRENETLYLYLEAGNPGKEYDDIEICTDRHIMYGAPNTHDVFIENLCLKYTGAHAICFANGAKRITVQGCEIGYVGGSMLSGQNVRYGNGFEVVDNCDTIVVRDNWVYQCFDAGITHQSSYPAGCLQTNITFSDNLIEYCTYNIEYYVSDENGRIENTIYENNILRFSGYGFGITNRIGSSDSVVANICCYARKMPVKNFIIRNNVLDSPYRFQTTIGCPNDTVNNLGPVVEGNTFIQQRDELAIVLINGEAKTNIWAKNQKELDEGIKQIDKAPASVTFE